MAIGLRSASRTVLRLMRPVPRLLSLLVISTFGFLAADGIAPQPDDAERRTEVVHRHFI